MKIVNIENNEWYFAHEVRSEYPELFNKLKSKDSERKYIEFENVNKNNYLFIYENKNKKITVSNAKNNRAKLVLKKTFIEEQINSPKKKTLPVIRLKNSQKFKNSAGTTFDIETRGELEVNKIYFLAKDIGNAFGIKRIENYIKSNKGSSYVEDVDFIYIDISNKNNVIKSEIFLTYFGVMKCIFSSHSVNAKHFQEWAINILFVHQLGNSEEKQELASSLIGVNIEDFSSILRSVSASSLSAIYLIKIGLLKDLKDIQCDEDENIYIFKYGFTEDLRRRCEEHRRKYGKLIGSDVRIYKFIYVDNNYLSEAEQQVKNNFLLADAVPIKYNNEKELIGIKLDSDGKKNIKNAFEILFKKFGGKLKDMQNQHNLNLQEEKSKLKHKYELQMQKNWYDFETKEKQIKWQHEKEIENNKRETEKEIETIKRETEQKIEQNNREKEKEIEQLRKEIAELKTNQKIQKLEHQVQFECKKRKINNDSNYDDDNFFQPPPTKKRRLSK